MKYKLLREDLTAEDQDVPPVVEARLKSIISSPQTACNIMKMLYSNPEVYQAIHSGVIPMRFLTSYRPADFGNKMNSLQTRLAAGTIGNLNLNRFYEATISGRTLAAQIFSILKNTRGVHQSTSDEELQAEITNSLKLYDVIVRYMKNEVFRNFYVFAKSLSKSLASVVINFSVGRLLYLPNVMGPARTIISGVIKYAISIGLNIEANQIVCSFFAACVIETFLALFINTTLEAFTDTKNTARIGLFAGTVGSAAVNKLSKFIK